MHELFGRVRDMTPTVSRAAMLANRFLLILLVTLSANVLLANDRESDFNFGWKFQLHHETGQKESVPLDDSQWREIRLPHDWSVEHSFDSDLEGCTGYLPGGVAWYQKHFPTPEAITEKKVFVLFDGVYNNARFWLNGQLLGENPYGYSPVFFDLTDHLSKNGSNNVLSVHVDRSRYADSRWYTGSGIYRNVKLVTVDKLHIPIWGTFLKTPEISDEKALVQLKTKVVNDRDRACGFALATRIVDRHDNVVAEQQEEIGLAAGETTTVLQEFSIQNPELWDTAIPNMYKAETTLIDGEREIGEYTTAFGIRSLHFDKDQGFFLNGKPTYVKGVCLHHDGGLVGAAVPKGVWRRRLQNLKDAGCNAIRTSHNPFSEEFLDLCDEMGFLVQNEIFDEMDNPKDKRHNMNEREVDYITRGYTEHFQQWGKSDLTRTMLRDRNHPCVFQWSIGNEIEWTYPHYQHVSGLWDPNVKQSYWNRISDLTADEMKRRYQALPDRKYKLTETASRLADWVRELDDTRPVTANLIIPVASLASGYAQTLDVVGFSYQTAQYNWAKKNYPDMLLTGNENAGTWQDWNSIVENPMVFSMFMWTGIDYMGEAHDKWPQKGWDGDMLDLAGFKKQGWNYFKSIWVNEPHLSIGTLPLKESKFKLDELVTRPVSIAPKEQQWANSNMHWNYSPGELVLVEVCTNHHTAELFLNGRSLGSRSLSDCPDRILRWVVPFQPGVLLAKAGFDGEEQTAELASAGKPTGIRLTTDQTELVADGYDVAHVVAQLIDGEGNDVKTDDLKLEFQVDGNIKILGVDNGSNRSVQDYQTNRLVTSQGRALLLLQSKRTTGTVMVQARADSLQSEEIVIEVAN